LYERGTPFARFSWSTEHHRIETREVLNHLSGRSIVTRTFTALVAAILVAAPARAQTPNEHLEAVRNLLRDTSAPPDGEAAKRIATLQQDFSEFASEYLLQDSSRVRPEPPETGSAARQASWRTRYLLVEADLTALLGAADAPGPTASSPGLDPELRNRLQQIRSHLQTFYAATIQAREGNPVAHTGSTPRTEAAANEQPPVAPTAAAPQTPPPVRANPDAPDTGVAATSAASRTTAPRDPAAVPTVGIDPATALLLLDRIQSILDAAVAKGESPTSVAPVGTSGTAGTSGGKVSAAGGKVTLDRGLFDEIRAELTQIRALLKK
jgi:hypothetical protein